MELRATCRGTHFDERELSCLDLPYGSGALAAKIVDRGAVPRKAVEDALDIAVATVHGVELVRMKLTLEVEQEEDGRWIAAVPELPGVLVYGNSREQAITWAEALALRVLAERLENGEPVPQIPILFAVA